MTLKNNDIFFGTRGPRNARIMIVGESWGQTEHERKQPFVGESGKDLDRLLRESGVDPRECFFTNVVSEKPPGNEMETFFHKTADARSLKVPTVRGLYPQENVLRGLDILHQQITLIKPQAIIGFGNYTLWALTANSFSIGDVKGRKVPQGIGQWRGSQLYTREHNVPFLPTYHPAAALRNFPWRYMIKHDLRARLPLALSGNWSAPRTHFQIRPSFSDTLITLSKILRELERGVLELSVDLETRAGQIACVGLAWSRTDGTSIPLMCVERPSGYFTLSEEFEIVSLLRQILTHHNVRILGQNFLYDAQYLYHQLFIQVRIDFDTMLMHHLLWPGGGDPTRPGTKTISQGIQLKALYNLSSLYCKHHVYWKDDGKNWDANTAEDVLWNYNCEDAARTFEIAQALKTALATQGLSALARDQMSFANDLALSMMLNGVLVNTSRRSEVSLELSQTIEIMYDEIDSLIPEDVWPREAQLSSASSGKRKQKSSKSIRKPWYRSPSQQAELFYNVLGVKPIIGKSGNPTTGKDALPIIARREPLLAPIIDKLEGLRSARVFFNTFLSANLGPDNRMYCSFNPAGTDTFRWSSSENAFGYGTNLQNLPKGDDEESDIYRRFPNIRKLFVPDPGYEIAEFDLSGADAQVVAWEADDADLKRAFRAKMKIHIKNAREVFPERTRNMSDEELKKGDHPGGLYYTCKRLIHASNYAGQPPALSQRLRLTIREVEDFQDRWFSLHPGISEWHRRTERFLAGTQCWNCNTMTESAERACKVCGKPLGRIVGNRFGYRIVYFDRIENLLPKALAWTPQSTVALNTFKGALALTRTLPQIKLLLQVHDSILVQYPSELRTHLLPQINSILHSVKVPYSDPLVIPWSCAISRVSWGDVEAVKW